jgi:AraC-like DNA-binding protein
VPNIQREAAICVANQMRLHLRVDQVTVNRVLESDELRMSLDKAADMACLSPTRFAHLFRDQVGLPFSRYMSWRKLTRAMVAIASERTIAAAAHAADFADDTLPNSRFIQRQ